MAKKRSSARTFLEKQHWAILPCALSDILARADENFEAFFDIGDAAFGSFKKQDNKAIIDISGVIFKRSNILTMLGLGTSTESASAQLDAALADASIEEIVLKIDSPGGMIDGTNAFADKVFNARAQKPITSVITGTAASAAFWIGSAANRIVATDETNLIGNIGAQVTVPKKGVEDKVTFISSNAPRKNLDPTSKEGEEVYQNLANRLESIFIEKVARNRGVEENYVKASYGRGDVLLAKEALKVNMIDELENFDGGNMDKKTLKEQHSALVDEIVVEATAPLKTSNEDLQAKLALATDEIATLKEKLTPKPTVPDEVRAQIENLEKQLLQSKLSGCLEEIQNDLLALHGKVPVDMIVALSTRFAEMQTKINEIGKGIGNSDTTDNIEAKIAEETQKLVEAGHSKTEAYSLAYRKFAQ